MRHYYYTICNKKSLYKCLVLYETMKENILDFKFLAVCLENESIDLIKQLNTIDLIPISSMELFGSELQDACDCEDFDSIEGFKIKAEVALKLFEFRGELDHLIWIDSQVGILSDMQLLNNRWEEASVFLMLNSKPKDNKEDIDCDYNTTIIGYRNDETGTAFLRSILNEPIPTKAECWQKRFENVLMLPKDDYCIELLDIKNEEVYLQSIDRNGLHIQGKKLCWHNFRGFEYLDGNHFDIVDYKDHLSDSFVKAIYLPYTKKCKEAVIRIKSLNQKIYDDTLPYDRHISSYFNYNVNQSIAESVFNFCTICEHDSLKPLYNLYNSLNKLNIKFRLWVCCLDNSTYNSLKHKQLSMVEVFHIYNVVDMDACLHSTNTILKYDLLHFILKSNYSIKELLYLEPNYYFLSNPRVIFNKIKESPLTLFKENEAKINIKKTYMVGVKRDDSSLKLLKDLVRKNRGMSEEELYCFVEHSYKAKLQDVGNLNLVDADTRNLRVFLNKNKLIFNKRFIIAVRYAFQIKESKNNKFIKLRSIKDMRTNVFLKEAGLPFVVCRHRAM